MAMYQFTATSGGVRIDVALRKQFPEIPPQIIRDSFQRRDVKCNGKRVKPDFRVAPGDVVQLFCMEQNATLINVVYEDENALIVNKRAGISVEADDGAGVTLTELVTRYVRK